MDMANPVLNIEALSPFGFFQQIPASPLSLPYAAFISKSVAYEQESGRMVVRETVKVRLAGCPDIRKARGLFEPKGLGVGVVDGWDLN